MSLCYQCAPSPVGGVASPHCERCGLTYNVERDEHGVPSAVTELPGGVAIVCTAETLAAIKRNRRASA